VAAPRFEEQEPTKRSPYALQMFPPSVRYRLQCRRQLLESERFVMCEKNPAVFARSISSFHVGMLNEHFSGNDKRFSVGVVRYDEITIKGPSGATLELKHDSDGHETHWDFSKPGLTEEGKIGLSARYFVITSACHSIGS
jgi:hypothetical protein